MLKQQGKLVVTGVWEAAVCVNSGAPVLQPMQFLASQEHLDRI